MSLQVWLPLTGDLHNQGLSNLNTINMPTCATIDNTGKIGKCYTSDGTADGVVTNFNFQASEFSIAAWVRINTRVNSWRCPLKLVNSSSAENYQYIGFCCEHNSQTSAIGFHFYKTIDGTNTSIFDSYAVTDMPVGEWVHLAVTYNGTIASCYKNGIKVSSVSITSANQNTIANIDRMVILGSNGSRGVAPVKSSLNDVRIYDHALSDKEVEEIAKGLVLHYKLDNNGLGGENLVTGSNTNNTSTNKWVGHSAVGGNTSSIVIDETGTPCVQVTRDNVAQSSWDYLSYDNFLRNKIKTNTTYSVSFDAKPSVDGNIGFTGFVNGNATNYMTNSTTIIQGSLKANQWNHCQYLCTTISSFSDITIGSQVVYFSRSTSLRGTNVTVLFKNIKVEEGNVFTPWSPNPADLDIDSSIIYDSSGYKNNGILHDTTAITTSNSSRYLVCLKNNETETSTNYLLKGNINMPESSSLTFAWWMNPTQFGKQQSGIFSTSANSLPTDYSTTAANMRDGAFDCCNISGTCIRISVANFITLNEWHHYALVYNGTQLIFYQDGVQKTTANQTGNLKSFTSIFPFYSLAGGVHRTTSGSLSDFRIYATALTAAQILELYHTSATIDNNGNVYAREVVE